MSRLRQGFILPTVLITMLLVALLATSLEAVAWHATQHARLGLAGERALLGADAAIARTLDSWDARAFASSAIGTRIVSSMPLTNGLDATVTLSRTAPDAALVVATATSTQNGTPLNAQREIARALIIRPPPLPLTTPLTTLGPVAIANPATVSDTDDIPPDWATECQGLTHIDAPMPPTNVTAARAQFDANWQRWLAVAAHSDDGRTGTTVGPLVTGSTCAPGAGEPFRGTGALATCTNEWGARAITGGATVTLAGTNRHQGVLLVDGDLVVTGTLDVRGLLIVRGALDASVGTVTVFGAVLVRDELGHGSRLGFASRVRYSRCALRRAVSAVGAPAAITTRGWLERF
jgi:hypothetical protein